MLTGGHVRRWRRVYRAALRRRDRRRVTSTTVLITVAAAATVTGFAQQALGASAIPWHGATSTLLVLLAAAHASAGYGAGDTRATAPATRRRATTSAAHGAVPAPICALP